MRKNIFLIGAFIWVLIAAMMLVILTTALSGRGLTNYLPEFMGDSPAFVWGSNTELVKEDRFSLSDIEALDIKAQHYPIKITLVEGQEMIVRQYDINSKTLFTSTTENSRLSVGIMRRNFTLMSISNPRLEIDLPHSYIEAIALETSSGSVRFSDGLTCTALKIKTSSGSINLGDIEADSVEIISSSGSQNVGNVKADMFRIVSSSGSLRYDGLSGEGSVTASSGSINCDALDVRGDTSIASSSGAQKLRLATGQNFEIRISTSSGSIRAADIHLNYSDNKGKNAFGTVGNGKRGTLSIEASSGSVNIN